jgi:predicted RNase H-like HicB family nuclease
MSTFCLVRTARLASPPGYTQNHPAGDERLIVPVVTIGSRPREENPMQTRKFVYYEEDGFFVGWLEEFPDYHTQGTTLEELEANLREIHEELTAATIPCVRRVGELRIA